MFENIHHFQQLHSCVGSNSCGMLMNQGNDHNGLYFGATHLQSGYDASACPGCDPTHLNWWDVYGQGKGWLADDQVGLMDGSVQGMFTNYSFVQTYWSDTTNMDNLRAADITNSSIAGTTETIQFNSPANNVRGGHSVHINSSDSYRGEYGEDLS